jgi:hypothetical protein
MRIGGMSAALQGLTAANARYEQAALRLVATAAGGELGAAAVGAGVTATTDATVQMATARYAFLASLRAAQVSTEMVGEAMRIG